MNFRIKRAGLSKDEQDLLLDPALEQTLNDLRHSVRAWSDDALARPRSAAAVRRGLWRLAAGWALGAVVAAAALSGGLYSHQQAQIKARLAAAQQAEQLRLQAEQQARDEEDLLAMVDSVVSRQVPRAMEPLVRLMDEEDDTQ